MNEILEKLNPVQRQAVETTEGPLLILAGAGSGKTRVITHRIAYLIQEKEIQGNRILAVTFTNKAAKEMKQRVQEICGELYFAPHLSTFHSFGVRLLRRYISLLGFKNNFNIYDDQDSKKLMKECMKELQIDDKKVTHKSLLSEISRAKNGMIPPEKFVSEYKIYCRGAQDAYSLYQETLKKYNAVDFDDLLFYSARILNEFPDVCDYYRDFFQYVMVDEFQDTNRVQFEIIRKLTEKHRNLCVVGDDDQSIYSWRGADISNIREFEKYYSDAVVVDMVENYRSYQNILDAASNLIENNCERLKQKRLFSNLGKGDKVEYFSLPDEKQEAEIVASTIQYHQKRKKISFSNFAIFYRTHSLSRKIEFALSRKKIPFKIIGSTSFYGRKEVKDIFAYIRCILNPEDAISLFRIINIPKRGIGNTTLEKIHNLAKERNISSWDVMSTSEILHSILSKRIALKVQEFVGLIEKLQKQVDLMDPSEFVKSLICELDYYTYLHGEYPDDGDDRVDNVREIASMVLEYEESEASPTLSGFLEHFSLRSDPIEEASGELEKNQDTVTLMTLHSAKGLEFDYVFIVGAEEDILPHGNSSGDHDSLEEERRLCYVGITRARKKLFITNARMRLLYGKYLYGRPSRFLQEIGDKCMERCL